MKNFFARKRHNFCCTYYIFSDQYLIERNENKKYLCPRKRASDIFFDGAAAKCDVRCLFSLQFIYREYFTLALLH